MVKKLYLFWELKVGLYVAINIKMESFFKDDDGDTTPKLHRREKAFGIVEEITNDKAIIRLANNSRLVVFNTGILATKDGRTFPYDVEEATESEFLSEKI